VCRIDTLGCSVKVDAEAGAATVAVPGREAQTT
jgi:hypothetical protein